MALSIVQKSIINIIDFFHRPVKRFIPEMTFRYAACGGGNMFFDIVLYHILHTYVLNGQIIQLEFIAISSHIAAFLIVFPITFSTGFLLARYITFAQSKVRGRIQLFRYAMTVLGSILMNYFLLKFFVEYCVFHPTLSKIFTAAVVITYSYFTQKYYTFKIKSKFK